MCRRLAFRSRWTLPPPARPGRRALPLLLAAPLLAVLLAACGGGDDDTITVAAVSPTPTPEVTPTAEPTPLPLPSTPADPLAGALAVSEYLRLGEPRIDDCLPELEAAWNLQPVEGPRCVQLDLDGDGRDELVLLVSPSPAPGASRAPSELWFFDDGESGYRYTHAGSALVDGDLLGLEILTARDLTGDGRGEVVATWERCEDGECTTHLLIAGHHGGALANLAPDVTIDAPDDIAIDDTGRIAFRPVVEHDASTGPRRSTTVTLAWGGSAFEATEEINPPEYLVHLVNDADDAYGRGEFATARQLFEQAAVDTSLLDWREEREGNPARAELQAYAMFRAGLAAQQQGDAGAALDLIARTAEEYTGTMHASAANVYRVAIEQENAPEVACSAMRSFLGTFADLYNAFWNYGSANPERSLFTVCP